MPPGDDCDGSGIGRDDCEGSGIGRDDCDGSGIGGREVRPDGASDMRRVCGAALDGGAPIGSTFAGGATPIDVCARGRMPDVTRFEPAPDMDWRDAACTDCATVRDDGDGGGAEGGRGACGETDERIGGRVVIGGGACADGFVPPPLGGPGRGGETVVDPAGLVVRAPSSLPVTFAGEGCRPSRSAKTALIRIMK